MSVMNYPKFYPGEPIPPENFANRKKSILTFERLLDDAELGSIRGVIISGERGVGKTSLLYKYEGISQKRSCLFIRVRAHKFTEESEFFNLIISRVGEALKKYGSLWTRLKTIWNDYEKKWGYNGTEIQKKKLPLQEEFHRRLQELGNCFLENFKVIIFAVDEADHIVEHPKILQIIRNVWEEIKKEGYKIMFIFAGKEDLSKALGKAHSPFKRLCVEIHVGAMDREDLLEIIERAQQKAKNKIPVKICEKIAEISNGLPHLVHLLGDQVVKTMKEGLKDPQVLWREAFTLFCEYEGLDEKYDSLNKTLSKQQKEILAAFGKLNRTHATMAELKVGTKLSLNSLSPQLGRLMENKIIERTERGVYKIVDPTFSEYFNMKMGYPLLRTE